MRGLFSLGQAVEAPPAIYASGPTQTGATREVDMKDLGQLTQVCQAFIHQLTGSQMAGGDYYQGCYVPSLDTVFAPAKGAWPSESERQDIIAHEWAHARGWRHMPDGTGTNPLSLKPKGLLGLGAQASPGTP